jgi:hypothetical protein
MGRRVGEDRGRTLAGLLSAALVAAFASAAPTQAATTVGQTSTSAECAPGYRAVQHTTGGPPGYVIPFDGVVTSFTVPGAPDTPTKLLLLEPVAGDTYKVAEKSEFGTFAAPVLQATFDARVPAKAGQHLGIYGVICAFAASFPGDAGGFATGPEPALGSTESFPISSTPLRISVSATLEADCDGDGFGDETQDASISSCHPRALTLDANKNKVKKGKKVTLSGRIAETRQGGACAANQTVELQRKKPSQPAFTTIEQLQTDATGSFSAKERLNRTFQYRAQAAETAMCAAGLSNTEKVKVKKKK